MEDKIFIITLRSIRKEVSAMTFRQLSYLVEISKCGSINKAAHNLFLSQTAISASIKELELELGISLFNRTNRGVEFTLDGREFLSYAISLLEQNNRIKQLYGENKKSVAPQCFSVSTQRYPFTEIAFIRMLQQTSDNNYRFSIKETGIDTVIDDVNKHQSDIGVISMTELSEKLIHRIMVSNEIEFHEIAAVIPCVFVRSDHPLAGLESVNESMLEDYPFVIFEHNQAAAVDFSEEYQLLWSKKPTRCISVTNRTSVYGILTSTDAFTTGSGLLVPNLYDNRIISIPLENEDLIHLGWIRSKSTKPFPQMEKFVDYLVESVNESIQYTEEIHLRLSRRKDEGYTATL